VKSQDKIGPSYKTYQPEKSEKLVYDELYFSTASCILLSGSRKAHRRVLPALIKVAAERNKNVEPRLVSRALANTPPLGLLDSSI